MICPTNVPRPKRPLHDFVPCFGRYANAARYRLFWSVASIPSTLDVARSIKPNHSLRDGRLLIVEILNAARWRGLFAMFNRAFLNSLGLSGGPSWTIRDLGSLTMFQIPAYDPVAIVMMGFGVVLAGGFGICIVIAF